MLISGVVLLTGFFGFFALRKYDELVDGDPFLRHRTVQPAR